MSIPSDPPGANPSNEQPWARSQMHDAARQASPAAETVTPLEHDAELQRFAEELPERGQRNREAARLESALAEEDHGEVSLQARTACAIFLTAFAVCLVVVAAILSSERSALRRADADLFGALGDQAAQAIIAHVDAAQGDLTGSAFDAVHNEIVLLAEMKGVRQVALFFGEGEEVLSACSAESAELRGAIPLPVVTGPGRTLRDDHLVVTRPFRLHSSDQADAMLVVEASYVGLERRMRDLVALSGRLIGLTAIVLVFLVPLLTRWLLAGLARASVLAQSGHALAVADVSGCGAEVVDLARRFESDQLRIDSLERSSASVVESARQHIQSLKDQRDVSDRAAEAARKEARDATAAKAAFVANTSHEVRTPLHAVLGANALLLETELDAEQVALAERSQHASQILLSLVDDVLDLARFDSREITLEESTFDPGKLVEEVADLAASLAAEKGLDLGVYVSPACPERLVGDPKRIRQALMRLTDNAIKFTESGEVSLDLSWEMGEDAVPRAIFTVADTGLGIDDEERARLFRAFEQLDASNTRRHGGVGLGLALVARIARAMGGEVRMESRRGRGSTFRLALPLAANAEETARITRGERPSRTPLAGVTVLLLDDSPLAARSLGRSLNDLGANTIVETSTYAGFENLLRSDIDVVMMDSLLPGRDAFLGAIETGETHKPRPVVLMAPPVATKVGAESSDEAVSAVVAKPLSRDAIVRVITRVLAPEDENGGRSAHDGPEHPTELLDSSVREKVQILLVEDNQTNQQLVQYILGKRGYQIDVASNGRRAVDAFAVGRYDAILMDCQMPEMDGYEATARIRGLESARGTRTPILAMTASVQESDRERCLTAGMDDMISKPFQPHRMVEWLETWLSRSIYVEGEGPMKKRVTRADVERELAARQAATPLVASPAETPGLSLQMASDRSAAATPGVDSLEVAATDAAPDSAISEQALEGALDWDVLGVLLEDEEGRVLASELIEGFLEVTPTKLRQMEHAVESGDLPACGSIAHGLVSTSGTVGAMRLAMMLRDIERYARGGNGIDSARIVAECRGEVEIAKRALMRAISPG